MKKLNALLILILSISINTQAQSWWSSKKVRGNGNVITKTRTIDKFDRVSVGGSFNVVLVQGKEGKVTIEGEENIIPYLETFVKNDKLKIKFKDNTNIRTTKKLTVTVAFEDVEGISLGGSGNVEVTSEIKGEDVDFNIGGSGNIRAKVATKNAKASIGGSGNIKLEGTTTNFKASIAGSGNIKAYDLRAENLKASIAGSGDVHIYATKKIKASVVGSGSVYYKGNPKYIDTKSVGSGDVIDRN